MHLSCFPITAALVFAMSRAVWPFEFFKATLAPCFMSKATYKKEENNNKIIIMKINRAKGDLDHHNTYTTVD